MKNLLFLSCLLNTACFDFLKTGEDDPEDDDERREGQIQGDCTDDKDNDDDDDIDCDDSGCSDKPACNDTASENPDSGETETDTGDTDEPDPVVTEVAINGMGVMFYNGYQGNDIAGAIVPSIDADVLTFGGFSVYLLDTDTQETCLLDWVVDADSTDADAAFGTGAVADGFGGDDLETWYGFTITSTPTVRAGFEDVCSNMDDFGKQLYDGLTQTTPAFGYGPMSSDLTGYIEAGTEEVSFTGIVGFDFLTDSGRSYYGLNQAFAYNIAFGTTNWDPSSSTYPQGTEIPASDVPFAEGFYVANAFLSISWQ
jgi:hypothetical protein